MSVIRQKHVHEILGSTKLAETGADRHNHRFAVISGQAICTDTSHVHRVFTRTDFFNNHFHFISGVSGPAIKVGNGKHVHFVSSQTSFNDGHRHRFVFASLIENPTGLR
ncbi:MAG: YmaF family protein [Chloroflexota bacterium]